MTNLNTRPARPLHRQGNPRPESITAWLLSPKRKAASGYPGLRHGFPHGHRPERSALPVQSSLLFWRKRQGRQCLPARFPRRGRGRDLTEPRYGSGGLRLSSAYSSALQPASCMPRSAGMPWPEQVSDPARDPGTGRSAGHFHLHAGAALWYDGGHTHTRAGNASDAKKYHIFTDVRGLGEARDGASGRSLFERPRKLTVSASGCKGTECLATVSGIGI